MKTEGKAEITIPDDVFFNPEMEMNRDITISALSAIDHATYIDALAATGIRGIRATLEAGYDSLINDINPEAVDAIERNLEINNVEAGVHNEDANIFLRKNHAEVVDIDPFGSPIPYLGSALSATQRVICLTATDTAPLCGAHSSGVRRYMCRPLNTEYHGEMGLRVLIGAVIRMAARTDVALTPMLSYASRHYVRCFLGVDRGGKVSDDALRDIGYIHHCFNCLHRESRTGIVNTSEPVCGVCGEDAEVAGPLWVGEVNDEGFVEHVKSKLSSYMGTADKAEKLLGTLGSELGVPMHFDHHVICKELGVSPSSLEEVLDGLREVGFDSSPTHYSGTSFKTDADISDIKSLLGE